MYRGGYSEPYCINSLTVAEGKKLRLVSDLRHVNKYLVVPIFKYENLKSLSKIFEHRGGYSEPYCINSLTVAEGKKLRLVSDLRHVNKYLVVPIFKYENLKSLSKIFEQGYYFFTRDRKQGYHHISIFLEYTQYLVSLGHFSQGSVISFL